MKNLCATSVLLIIILNFSACAPVAVFSTSGSRFSDSENKQETEKMQIPDENSMDSSSENSSEEFPLEENPDDFISNYEEIISIGVPVESQTRLLIEITRYLKTPYRYGGLGPNGFDCSGLINRVFLDALEVELPRTVEDMFYSSQIEKEQSNPEFGDIVFFKLRKRHPDHAGIYLGNGLFVHSSSSRGVIVSPLKSDYYSPKYLGFRKMNILMMQPPAPKPEPETEKR